MQTDPEEKDDRKMQDSITPQINAAHQQQMVEHGQREYEQRRNHEYSLVIEYYRQERQRIERVIYFIGAIPIAMLALKEFQDFPKFMLGAALAFSFFAYAYWYVNEVYGGHWRIDDARKRADLWFRFATQEDQQRLADERESFESGIDPSGEAARTSKYVVGLIFASFFSSLFAYVDQVVDIAWLSTPSMSLATALFAAICVALTAWWIYEFIRIDRLGAPY